MSAHTPGLWIYGVRKDGSIWVSLGDPATGAHHQFDWRGTVADVTLALAAPTLLEAAQKVAAFYDEDCYGMRDLRAAIAAATGEME